MKALYFDGQNFEERDLPSPQAGKGEALVKINMAGICSTDVEIIRGYMNFRGVPGHEFVGTVIEASTNKLMGKRVVGEINVPCHSCPTCLAGLSKHCPQRSVLGISDLNGVFAEFTVLPEVNLHIVPENLNNKKAVFTEPLAAACEITSRFDTFGYENIAVLGDGKLAVMLSQVLALHNPNLTVIGKNQKKMNHIGKLGFDTIRLSQRDSWARKFDMIVECTGSPDGLPIAVQLIKPAGLIILKTTYHGSTRWNPSMIAVDEISIAGSRCGPFDTALELLSRDKIETDSFISGIYPFTDWRDAFKLAKGDDTFKVLLEMS